MDLTNKPSVSAPGLVSIVIAGVLIIAGGFLIGSLAPLLFPTQASAEAQQIDTLFRVFLTIGGGLFLLVQGLLLYSIIRFRARPGDTSDGVNMHGSMTLEFIWTAIPAVVVLVLVVYSYQVWTSIRTVKDDELSVVVEGQRFAWTFIYQDPLNRLTEAPTQTFSDSVLHTYVGRPVVLSMTTQDVNHAFWVPAMRVKQDLIAGKTTEIRFTPTEPGEYRVVCAELCGGGHGQMYSFIRVYEDKQAWMDDFIDIRVNNILNPPDDPVLLGALIMASGAYPCAGCHILVDEKNAINWQGLQGPSLVGIGDTAVRRAAAAGNASPEEYLAESIRHPNDYIVPGYSAGIMPQFGPTEETPAVVDGAYYRFMSDTDLVNMVAYMCTVTATGESACGDLDSIVAAVEAQR